METTMENNVQGNETTQQTQQDQQQQQQQTVTDKYSQYYADSESTKESPNEELVGTVQALTGEIQSLKQQLTAQQENKLSAAEKQNFISLLQQGKVDEAEEYLTRKAASQYESRLEQRIQQLQEDLYARSHQERQVNEFITKLKADNPDIVPLERLITANAEAKLQQVLASGRVKTQAALMEVYRKVVLEEVNAAKQLVQQLRGAGKQEAMTTKETVLSSSPVRSNTITSNGDVQQKDEKKPMTASEYLQSRMSRSDIQKRRVLAS